MQPAVLVTLTQYVPGVFTSIEGLVEPVLHKKAVAVVLAESNDGLFKQTNTSSPIETLVAGF
jgi:hypothetical protein